MLYANCAPTGELIFYMPPSAHVYVPLTKHPFKGKTNNVETVTAET